MSNINEADSLFTDCNANLRMTILPTIPTMEATGHVYESIAGEDIFGNASNAQSKKQPSTRQRMKFKDCGVQGNKTVFIRPQDLE